jgi:hypothetical protein
VKSPAKPAVRQIIAVGWPFSTPRLNYHRDLLWRNPSRFKFAAILFERRLVPDLHGIPIVEIGELHDLYSNGLHSLLTLSLNKKLIANAQATLVNLGIPCQNADAFVREALHSDLDGFDFTSPFPEIDAKSLRLLMSSCQDGRFARLTSPRAVGLVQDLSTAWVECRWDRFFDWTSQLPRDSRFSEQVNESFERGVRDFVICSSRQESLVDLIIHHGALHRSAEYRVHLHGSAGDIYSAVSFGGELLR